MEVNYWHRTNRQSIAAPAVTEFEKRSLDNKSSSEGVKIAEAARWAR